MSYDRDMSISEEVQQLSEERETPCEDIGGVAGSGKTYRILKNVASDPSWGILSSPTGIAAVNLGAITVHSLLKFSTTDVARDSFLNGTLTRIIHALARDYRRLVIDEKSMLDGELLDIIYRATCEANRYADVPVPMGITLVGDFAQLPPVRAKWCFEAACWEKFEANSTILKEQWRQTDDWFIEALNYIRQGNGDAGAALLQRLGVRWETILDTEFDGTTILPKNDQVGRYNAIGLDRVKGTKITVTSRRWGKQRSEWGLNERTREWGIPQQAEFKIGAYVMLLSNQSDGEGGFEFVNGDCGHIVSYLPNTIVAGEGFDVELVRNNNIVRVRPIVRHVDHADKPSDYDFVTIARGDDNGSYIPRPHYRSKARRYVVGQIEYFPMRLAYASTIHKSQSLTLDRVQVDYRNHFFGGPGFLYVALSRARTLSGLRLVGQRDVFIKRCNVDERVRRWL